LDGRVGVLDEVVEHFDFGVGFEVLQEVFFGLFLLLRVVVRGEWADVGDDVVFEGEGVGFGGFV